MLGRSLLVAVPNLCAILLAILLAAGAPPALPSDSVVAYPTRPIRWIVPLPAGGAADTVSRTVGRKLTEALGQQVVVDNRPGAGGNLGTEIAARAAPDGYTLVIVPATYTTSPSLQRNVRYDPIKDFAPITLVSSATLVLVVNLAVPATTVKELIALARGRSGHLNYAATGIGTSSDMAAELFKTMAGINIVRVTYKGQPLAMADLLSGDVHTMFPNMPVILSHIRAGRVRPLAVTGLKRSTLTPQLPTMAESGLRGFEVSQWSGLLAPAGTPKPIITKLHEEISRILEVPDVRSSLTSQGFEPGGNTPQQFDAYIKAEIKKWAKLIKDAGISAK